MTPIFTFLITVVPARAGMSPWVSGSFRIPAGGPRASGDEPADNPLLGIA